MLYRHRLPFAGIMLVSLGLLMYTTLPTAVPPQGNLPVAFLQSSPRWADSVLATLSPEEKLGQLLILAVSDTTLIDSMGATLNQYRPGGVIWRGFEPDPLIKAMSVARQRSPLPLLMGMATGPYRTGLYQLPAGLGLGALREDSLLQPMGDLLARQAQALGIHLLMLPSLSRAYQPENTPTLTHQVSTLTTALQARRLLVCQGPMLPFLPVMGDTSRYDSLLAPYRRLLQAGPAAWQLGPRPAPRYRGFPHPVSALQSGRLNYRGLVLGQVPAESRDWVGSMRELLRQGVELFILTPAQLSQATAGLRQLYRNGELAGHQLDQRVRRLLLAKTWTQADRPRVPDTTLLRSSRWAETVSWQQHDVYARSLAVIRDSKALLPIGEPKGKAVHLLTLNEPLPDMLAQLRAYGPTSHSMLGQPGTDTLAALPVEALRRFEPVILTLTDQPVEQLDDQVFQQSLQQLAALTPVIVVNLGDPRRLALLPQSVSLVQGYGYDSVNQRLAAQLVMGGLPSEAQLPLALGAGLAFGQREPRLVTRLSYGPAWRVGVDPQALQRIDTIAWSAIQDFAMPGCQVLVARRGQVVYQRAYGHHTYARRRPVDPTDLYDLASMTKVVATTMAAMLMVDRGKMRLSDSLARFFKDDYVWIDTAVVRDTLFVRVDTGRAVPDTLLARIDSLDLSTEENLLQVPPRVPVVRVSQTRGQRPPDRIDSLYLSADSIMVIRAWSLGRRRVRSRMLEVSLTELLTHHSGLSAALPIVPYLSYRKKGAPRFGRYFQPRADSLYRVKVADHFYLRQDYLDSIWQATKRMRVAPDKSYHYSDANLILVQQAIDSLNGFGIDSLLKTQLYEPLGMQQTGFRPLRWAEESRIVPTENDQRWRYQLLRGHVHDETAALLGGVAGNAGLFANANDLAHLFQMLLNGGTYGGKRYLREQTVSTFTRRQRGHRALGFDMPPSQGEYIIGRQASPQSYGHLGFTGTCVWVDPKEELIFIFLSNRVHPTNRWRLNELEVRERIHDAVYEALRDF